MAGRLRKSGGGGTFSYMRGRPKEMKSTDVMRMITSAIDGRICSVPYDKEVVFNITLAMKDRKIIDYLIVKDCGTPKPDDLLEIVLVNMLSQAMPRYSMLNIYDESLVYLELITINTKIVECRISVVKGSKV